MGTRNALLALLSGVPGFSGAGVGTTSARQENAAAGACGGRRIDRGRNLRVLSVNQPRRIVRCEARADASGAEEPGKRRTNLEGQSQVRGTEKQPAGELQRLPRKPLALSIYLPFGSEPGAYEVRVLNTEDDAQPIATYTATAQIENGLTVLRLTMDLSSVSPGPHVLATRHDAETWRYFRFVVG